MSGSVHPSCCGECREHHDPRPYNERGDRDTCNPRGTRWHLLLDASHKACRSVHAIRRREGTTHEQEAML